MPKDDQKKVVWWRVSSKSDPVWNIVRFSIGFLAAIDESGEYLLSEDSPEDIVTELNIPKEQVIELLNLRAGGIFSSIV